MSGLVSGGLATAGLAPWPRRPRWRRWTRRWGGRWRRWLVASRAGGDEQAPQRGLQPHPDQRKARTPPRCAAVCRHRDDRRRRPCPRRDSAPVDPIPAVGAPDRHRGDAPRQGERRRAPDGDALTYAVAGPPRAVERSPVNRRTGSRLAPTQATQLAAGLSSGLYRRLHRHRQRRAGQRPDGRDGAVPPPTQLDQPMHGGRHTLRVAASPNSSRVYVATAATTPCT